MVAALQVGDSGRRPFGLNRPGGNARIRSGGGARNPKRHVEKTADFSSDPLWPVGNELGWACSCDRGERWCMGCCHGCLRLEASPGPVREFVFGTMGTGVGVAFGFVVEKWD
ncbi:uncharacterized protein L203_103257 [Cryptococcus depauperatus CBS 7841]|uniref:Uncharacterized protein n=1 Tax=Cryptococcus depauperatus CBS 7841 TaxID=1295531 RepID=A0AAJ8JTD1_9TREE